MKTIYYLRFLVNRRFGLPYRKLMKWYDSVNLTMLSPLVVGYGVWAFGVGRVTILVGLGGPFVGNGDV